MKSIVALAGMKYRGTEDLVRTMKDGEAVRLVRERDNAHDPNAVQVWAKDGAAQDVMLGFLKAGLHAGGAVALLMDRRGLTEMNAKLKVTADRWPMIEVDDDAPGRRTTEERMIG